MLVMGQILSIDGIVF